MNPLEPVVLHVTGVPTPAGSKSAFRNPHTGRIAMVDGKGPSVERHKAWRTLVASAASEWVEEHPGFVPLDGPLWLRVSFWLPRPASAKRWKWLADKRPDLGKLVRATEDSLSRVVIADDARIVALDARKVYAIACPPGALVEVGSFAVEEELMGREWLVDRTADSPGLLTIPASRLESERPRPRGSR